MADSPGAGLAKVVIAAPKRRLDLALPEQIPLAMLLPSVLPRADEALADSGLEHGGWTLRRLGGLAEFLAAAIDRRCGLLARNQRATPTAYETGFRSRGRRPGAARA